MDPFAGWFWVWRGPSAGSASGHVGLLSWKLGWGVAPEGGSGLGLACQRGHFGGCPGLREGPEWKGRGEEGGKAPATCLCLHPHYHPRACHLLMSALIHSSTPTFVHVSISSLSHGPYPHLYCPTHP